MQYGMFYVYRCEQSGGQGSVFETAHQTAHTDACRTHHRAYAAASLWMNQRSLKHVGDMRMDVDEERRTSSANF